MDFERWGWELGGFCGVDPEPRTLRELVWLASGRVDFVQAQAGAMSSLFSGRELTNPFRAALSGVERGPVTDEESKLGFAAFGEALKVIARQG